MGKENRSFLMYLKDIQLSMSRIAEYISGMTYSSFIEDPKTIDAVVRNFEIIGEASKSIPDHIRETHPTIPWKEMYYLRNRISHEYFGVDYTIIWDIATNYLPENKQEVDQIIIAYHKNQLK